MLKKRQIAQENKDQLVNVIAELDQEKNRDVRATVKEVDQHFNSIFSVLLPGTKAMLEQIYDKANPELLIGLKLRVAFSGEWKESLSELSGGQRSLLALSLILALLKYQPAPVYILDEIDSALDLSHTQNIGLMIRKYFKSSQFVIVSLKEGLF